MKFLFALLFSLLALNPQADTNSSNSPEEIIEEIMQAFKTSNVATINANFASDAEFSFDDGTICKPGVQNQLFEFFRNYPPLAFQAIHKGKSARSTYMIGEYKSEHETFGIQVFIDHNKAKIAVLKILKG